MNKKHYFKVLDFSNYFLIFLYLKISLAQVVEIQLQNSSVVTTDESLYNKNQQVIHLNFKNLTSINTTNPEKVISPSKRVGIKVNRRKRGLTSIQKKLWWPFNRSRRRRNHFDYYDDCDYYYDDYYNDYYDYYDYYDRPHIPCDRPYHHRPGLGGGHHHHHHHGHGHFNRLDPREREIIREKIRLKKQIGLLRRVIPPAVKKTQVFHHHGPSHIYEQRKRGGYGAGWSKSNLLRRIQNTELDLRLRNVTLQKYSASVNLIRSMITESNGLINAIPALGGLGIQAVTQIAGSNPYSIFLSAISRFAQPQPQNPPAAAPAPAPAARPRRRFPFKNKKRTSVTSSGQNVFQNQSTLLPANKSGSKSDNIKIKSSLQEEKRQMLINKRNKDSKVNDNSLTEQLAGKSEEEENEVENDNSEGIEEEELNSNSNEN